MKPHEERLPPRALPLVYFAAGYASLALALLTAAAAPESIAGFFYHAKMFYVVHLITLGWTTTAILGAIYIVGPLALRMPVPSGKLDWIACILTLLGISGVISHFYLGGYSGVAWSGKLLLVSFGLCAFRVFKSLRRARSPAAVKAHIVLAYVNLLLTATLGILLAINKQKSFLPGSHLTDVFGHAHLGAAGWVVLMVMGIGYRLIPMFLPAKPPDGPRVWATAVLTEIGVIGLPLAFLWNTDLVPWFAVMLALGLVMFFVNVAGMLRDPRPPPVKLKRPDVGMLHTLQSIGYLVVCTGIGLFLSFSDDWHLGAIMVYGVCLLLGFMAQIVLGIGMRLLPMFSWLEAWAGGGYEVLPTSQYAMPSRPLQWAVFWLWTAGVPTVAYGLARDAVPVLSTGAWLLFAGVVLSAINSIRVVRHAFR